MANLFIIGNGFDIAHGMKTKYSDFRKYLISKYLDEDPDNLNFEVPYSNPKPDGGSEYNDADVVLAIIKLLDKTEGILWNDIESSLGILDYSDIFEELEFDTDHKNLKHQYYNNEDIAMELCEAISLIQKYFHSWIKTIKISTTQLSDFQKLINPQKDLFLNFNYTRTLEKLYDVKNICHIHGSTRGKIYFGHGDDKDSTEDYQNDFLGAEYELNRLKHFLKKNTYLAYKKNIRFFSAIKKMLLHENLNIYSYGFSFSDVDKFYLKKIFLNTNTENICFYMNDYDKKSKRKQFEKILKECGFNGKISSFHITN